MKSNPVSASTRRPRLGAHGAPGLILAAAALLAGPVRAQDPPWQGEPFTGEPAAIASAAQAIPHADDAQGMFLLSRSTFSFDAEGRSTRRMYSLYRVYSSSPRRRTHRSPPCGSRGTRSGRRYAHA